MQGIKLTDQLIGLLLGLVLLQMEKNEAEQEEPGHHAERGGVVRVRRLDKPLVLVVGQRTHRELSDGQKSSETRSVVVHLELIHSVHVRNLESALEP